MMKNTSIAILLGATVLVATAVGYAVVMNEPPAEEQPAPGSPAAEETSMPEGVEDYGEQEDDSERLMVGSDAIFVASAMPGGSVEVGFAVLSRPGFVIIHEDDEGSPGAIVGSSEILLPGDNRDLAVPLVRASVDGETLYAMLHADDGDGEFNAADDGPVTDDKGNVIFMRFEVSSEAEGSGVITL